MIKQIRKENITYRDRHTKEPVTISDAEIYLIDSPTCIKDYDLLVEDWVNFTDTAACCILTIDDEKYIAFIKDDIVIGFLVKESELLWVNGDEIVTNCLLRFGGKFIMF